ncbi:MAG: LysR family transcriptional regulator [Gammaproteobacteria bacterium]
MDIETVRIFVDVMKYRSFAAAARQRDIDPSSVSRSISALESELGVRLLQRTTRKLAPTEAGAQYFARIEGLVREFDRAGQQALDVVGQPTGTLRVTACTSFGQRILAPLLPKLRVRCPELTIDLVLADHQVDIVEEQIDLAVRFGEKPSGGFMASRLVPRRFHVCASPSYIEAHGMPTHPRELENLDCLLFPFQGYRRVWKFRKGTDSRFDVPVSGHLIISHGMTMTACAVQGLGPALLPDWLCREEIAAGTLINVFHEYECTATSFDTAAWLVYPSRNYTPLKLRVFIDFLRSEVTGFA